MATKVFISWSGELSKKLGEALRNWLPAALQYVKPYFSPDDIEKGAKWNSEITNELATSDMGLICLTQDNTEKPWIVFEAGALSKSIDKSRVCTLLFNLDAAEIKGPLTSFQATRFNRDDFKRLVASINNVTVESKLDSSVLDSVFEMWWPRLEEQITQILTSHDKISKKARRSDRDILEEILELTRMNSSRYAKLGGLSEAWLVELMEVLDDLVFYSGRRGSIKMETMRQLERIIRHLALETGRPEMARRLSISMRKAEEKKLVQGTILTTDQDNKVSG